MSTTVTYKGSVITTAENNTKVLETANTWLEDDITLVDVTSGGGGTLGTKTITQNGTYNATDDDLDGYSAVTVNVSGGITPTGTKQISITENGTITEDVTNYASAEITVAVSGGIDVDGIATNTEPSGTIALTATSIQKYAFAYKPITDISAPNVTQLNQGAFSNCRSLASVSFPSVRNIYSSNVFEQCRALTTLVFPSLVSTQANNIVVGCSNLTTVDIGPNFSSVLANVFAQANKLATLILRKSDAIVTLANVSAFTNTPFRGYNSLVGTVYVPTALIESYKTATNWSTLYNNGTCQFSSLEGSQYESYYADGNTVV